MTVHTWLLHNDSAHVRDHAVVVHIWGMLHNGRALWDVKQSYTWLLPNDGGTRGCYSKNGNKVI